MAAKITPDPRPDGFSCDCPLKVLVMVAAVCWLSAVVLFAVGNSSKGPAALRYAVIPDAIVALVVTVAAARRWSIGS